MIMPNTGGTTVTTGTGSYGVTFPSRYTTNTTEFGKAFDLSLNALHEESTVTMAYEMVLKDYFKVKKENFPNWDELPEIQVSSNGFSSRSIRWHIWVPDDQIVDPNIKEEEDLWQS
jgi:hypothetical protein